MLFWSTLLTLGLCTALAGGMILCFFNFVGRRNLPATTAAHRRPVSLESEIGPRALAHRPGEAAQGGVVVLEGRNISYGVS